jgi:uncharacterized membrane protein
MSDEFLNVPPSDSTPPPPPPVAPAPGPAGVTSDDKLWALLAYIFTPLMPIIIMVMDDKKNRPFLRAHNAQALALGVVSIAVWTLLGWLCIPGLAVFAYQIYLGMQAYNGKTVEIPVISKFCRDQGWA